MGSHFIHVTMAGLGTTACTSNTEGFSLCNLSWQQWLHTHLRYSPPIFEFWNLVIFVIVCRKGCLDCVICNFNTFHSTLSTVIATHLKIHIFYSGQIWMIWGRGVCICSVRYWAYLIKIFLSFILWCPLRFPHENDVGFVFTSSCFTGGSCLLYIMYVCL